MSEAIEEPQLWKFCPACGTVSIRQGSNPFHCSNCEFVHYFSPNVATGALISSDAGELLFIVRAKDPGRGLLGFPGGFVDADETAEAAVIREVQEELNLQIESVEYLASFPNTYSFRQIRRPVTDLFFTASVSDYAAIKAQQGEVEGWKFLAPEDVHDDQLAFDTHRQALDAYLRRS